MHQKVGWQAGWMNRWVVHWMGGFADEWLTKSGGKQLDASGMTVHWQTAVRPHRIRRDDGACPPEIGVVEPGVVDVPVSREHRVALAHDAVPAVWRQRHHSGGEDNSHADSRHRQPLRRQPDVRYHAARRVLAADLCSVQAARDTE